MNHTVSVDEFTQEFAQLDQQPDIVLELSPTSAWCLMAQIQLACRHPSNEGPSRAIAESIARDIQLVLATTPALAAVAEHGWDASYDEEVDGESND